MRELVYVLLAKCGILKKAVMYKHQKAKQKQNLKKNKKQKPWQAEQVGPHDKLQLWRLEQGQAPNSCQGLGRAAPGVGASLGGRCSRAEESIGGGAAPDPPVTARGPGPADRREHRV